MKKNSERLGETRKGVRAARAGMGVVEGMGAVGAVGVMRAVEAVGAVGEVGGEAEKLGGGGWGE